MQKNFFLRIFLKMRTIYINLSFAYKLFLVFIVVTLVPEGFIQLYSYNAMKSQLTSQAYQNMKLSVSQIANNIEKKMDNYAQKSDTFYNDLELKENLTKLCYTTSDYMDVYTFVNSYVRRITSLDNSIDSITVFTNNESIPSDLLYIKQMDKIPTKNIYNEVLQEAGKITYSTAYKNSINPNTTVFSILRSLNYFDFLNPYGILSINVKESELYSLIEKEIPEKAIFVVNQNNSIITSKDKKLISKNINDVIDCKNVQLGTEGSFDIEYLGKHSLVVYSTIKNGWRVFSLVTYEQLLSNAKKTSMNLMMIYFLSIFISVPLIYLTSNLFSKRIKYLSKKIKSVKSGEFDINVRDMGNDELGQVIKSFKHMAEEVDRLIKEEYEAVILKRTAEMDSLQAQIRPHFLYNTLNTISVLALKQNDLVVVKMVKALAKFYRISLNKGKNEISIKQEFELTQNYIYILKVRFEGLLHFTIQCDDSILDFKTPKLLLQPFIENCINHAIYDDKNGINIIIKAYRKGDNIEFKVIDDGIGMSIATLSELMKSGYGIKNVNDRIKLLHGDDYGVSVYSRPGIGTSVTILIPLIEY
ncbi:MAG TPA: sensor histidine kinase [Ruminiclostridium sp.]